MLNVEVGRSAHEPTAAVILANDLPHLFTAFPEGAPPDLPSDHVHAPLLVEFDEGVDALAQVLGYLSGAGECRVGFDDMSAATMERLPVIAPKLTIGDAGPVLAAAKILKTDDEVECIRRAQRINELAMYDVYANLRPGVRQSELSGIFLRRIFELGASANSVDPIWQVMPNSIAARAVHRSRRRRISTQLEWRDPA